VIAPKTLPNINLFFMIDVLFGASPALPLWQITSPRFIYEAIFSKVRLREH
jgi:hypothetical protein